MLSLWRLMAVRWLGGAASDALAGDVVLRDLLLPKPVATGFEVHRISGVSHRAMMLQHQAEPEPATAIITDRGA